MGRIGTQTAKRAKAFGIDIIYHNRHKIPSKIGKWVTLDYLLKKSDVLSIHVPSTKETLELIDLIKLKKMKKNFFYCTARGKIIKESDLILALKKKIISGAALDVSSKAEPIGKTNALTKMQNVVLAPHIGSSTDKTRAKMARQWRI